MAGIPQGSPLSPLLANIYVAEFDRKVRARHSLMRYADDMVIVCRTEEEAERGRKEVEEALANEGLRMKPSKTRIARLESGVEFLGYRLTGRKADPSAKSVRRLHEKMRSSTVWHDTRPLAEVIPRVMAVVRGWSECYRLRGESEVLGAVTLWLTHRLQAYKVKHRWGGRGSATPRCRCCMGLGSVHPTFSWFRGPDEVEKAVRGSCAYTAWGGGAGSQGPAPTLLRRAFVPAQHTGSRLSSDNQVLEVGSVIQPPPIPQPYFLDTQSSPRTLRLHPVFC